MSTMLRGLTKLAHSDKACWPTLVVVEATLPVSHDHAIPQPCTWVRAMGSTRESTFLDIWGLTREQARGRQRTSSCTITRSSFAPCTLMSTPSTLQISSKWGALRHARLGRLVELVRRSAPWRALTSTAALHSTTLTETKIKLSTSLSVISN
ncbi:hypothetical protein Zm00014a_007718 [Zea mays]|uniref:Uncharacterized protein n=1 Tax=Zea mays TaxID=4577 RepID=A0A3L6GAI9_MAIZE|nr:hypothetical protein Zm00014a_007718 [Zea mays]